MSLQIDLDLLPSEIALELVPNSYEALTTDSEFAAAARLPIRSINIPEMRSKAIKGYHAADHLLRKGYDAIPHFRTIDRTYEDLVASISPLIPLGLKSVLLITGDPIKDPNFQASGNTPTNVTPRLKKEFPGLKIFVGMDPYRQSFRAELEYCQEKIAAGVDGFFTQPFFSSHLLELWLEQLPHTEIWVGVSPVTTASFKGYWEKTNKVVFPPNFSIDLAANCQNERELLAIAKKYGQKAYLMPVTVSTELYLPALFG